MELQIQLSIFFQQGIIYPCSNDKFRFLSSIVFNNAFSHKSRVQLCFKMKYVENETEKITTQFFSQASLIFKLQQEVIKVNDMCMPWSLPETDPETNFLNLENQSFENVSFLSI